ncbi:hypothetical protein [Bacteroides sp.]|uniref:hypothetical protein n=1 Tax=Bacteroides sp. TaxID=29523 RepID=UPI0026273906|nr:hypothetical protein [Bacteroides sp.]MDD3039021.1 hypothetical protein [Bacteroides sp.]
MVTSIIQDLRVQPLGVKPFIGTGGGKVVPDSAGFYYQRGTPVKITGNHEVGVAGENEASIGVLETGIHKNQAPDGLDTRHRLNVTTPFNYLIRGTAGGIVAAGANLQMGANGKYVVQTDKPLAGVALTGGSEDATIEILI